MQLAWANADRNSTVFANVIPTKLYKLTNQELHSAASVCLGIPNPVCIPHIGTSLVRGSSEDEEDDDDADRARRGDTVDAFGFTVSARVQQAAPWKRRHDQFADRIVQMMQFSGMKARAEPRNVVNRHVLVRSGEMPRRMATPTECSKAPSPTWRTPTPWTARRRSPN